MSSIVPKLTGDTTQVEKFCTTAFSVRTVEGQLVESKIYGDRVKGFSSKNRLTCYSARKKAKNAVDWNFSCRKSAGTACERSSELRCGLCCRYDKLLELPKIGRKDNDRLQSRR